MKTVALKKRIPSLLISSLFMSLLLVGPLAQAISGVRFSKTKTTFKGAITPGVELDLKSFYTQITKCDLSENENINADGQLLIRSSKVIKKSESAYALQVADSASIGKCLFRLDSIYMTVAKNDVLEPINFRTPTYIKEMNDALKADGLENALITTMPPNTKFDCPFDFKDGMSCSVENSEVGLYEFGILAAGESYTMDFLNKPNHPIEFPVYSGADLPQL